MERRGGGCRAIMLYLMRLIVIAAVLAGLGYGALLALTTFVKPEQRDIVITIPMPKTPPPA